MQRTLRLALVLGLIGATVVAGCGVVHRETWRATDGRGAVSVSLCGLCAKPYDFQVTSATEVMAAKCPQGYTVLQEGTTPSGEDARGLWSGPKSGEGPLTYQAIQTGQKWYWEFECTR